MEDFADVQIFNYFGQSVKNTRIKNELNVSELKEGLYFIVFNDKNALKFYKK
ncbi:T9SS type A sorting domain-containing protein [Flavobacterium sp.]|uniref:T9SS type A sorting domain-containing protein n=1 Tax=Flavobacterium sp. TaxID=239 RepID=UPI003751B0CB